jgi:hypothetical protein
MWDSSQPGPQPSLRYDKDLFPLVLFSSVSLYDDRPTVIQSIPFILAVSELAEENCPSSAWQSVPRHAHTSRPLHPHHQQPGAGPKMGGAKRSSSSPLGTIHEMVS